jgi:apolipoprotein N-acyltransferase
MLFGSLDSIPGTDRELNAVYLVEPSHQHRASVQAQPSTPSPMKVGVYHKRVLLPFGEYVPAARWLPMAERWKATGRFVAGETPTRLAVRLSGTVHRTPLPATKTAQKVSSPLVGEGSEGGAIGQAQKSRERPPSLILPRKGGGNHVYGRRVSLGVSVCFEAIRPGWFNQAVRDGARFLVNVTDDGWFGNSATPEQHLELTRLRAVETRRWLVRASNSGISAFIDPTGQVVASLAVGRVGALEHEVSLVDSITPYVRWGDFPMLLLALGTISVWAFTAVARGSVSKAPS